MDPDARLPGWESMEVICAYEKDQWSLLFGVFPGRDDRSSYASTQEVDIPGTDEAWVVPPASESDTGVLVVTVDERTWKVQFSGTTDDAVAVARRVLGV
ncbi:hypothetical protein ALI22I_11425 [Saccharothrix sp. ALI-22-I]|nr:hypothetical protein ALI22I_11425 [Saccharothrix sp. ALI-22-I]